MAIKIGTVCSLVMDGMDQSHCKVPYLGRNDGFQEALPLGVTGVKIHGYGATFYRTVATVYKSANLSIYCLLCELENWKRRYRKYPQELYIQVDGGSENANKFFLAMLELLVVKRICKIVYYTRLPRGHTHSDIDGLFGKIWKHLRPQCYETLDKHSRLIVDTFKGSKYKGSKLEVNVKDVMVCPDYCHLVSSCIDPKFGRLHKGLQTQHQWRFEGE
jgi:hypothetical protein